MVDTSAAQHGVVLNLGAAQRRAVRADDDELGCTGHTDRDEHGNKTLRSVTLSLTEALQSGQVAEAVLAALHDESEARVDGLGILLLLQWRKCPADENLVTAAKRTMDGIPHSSLRR